MKKKYAILIAVVTVICIGAAIGYKIWNKPFTDPLSGNAINVTAEQLFSDFSNDEIEAQKKYVPQKLGDKTLEITGVIKELGKNEDRETYYVLKTSDDNFGVKCILDKGDENPNAKTGDQIQVRGFCTGFNMDVIVNRCKVVNNQ